MSWLDSDLLVELEGRTVTEQVASGLSYMFDERPNTIECDRYPPW